MARSIRHTTVNLFAFLVVAGLIGAMSASVASAASIGVNFEGNGNGVGAVSVTGSAGVVPQSNWNNYSGSGGTMSSLINDGGASTGASVNVSGAAGTYTVGQSSPVGGDQQLNDGFIYTNGANPTTVTLSNIPYGTYSLYIYQLNDAVSRVDATTFGSTTYYGAAASAQDANHVSGSANTYQYLQTTSTNATSPTPNGDYLVFTNLHGSTQTFSLLNPASGVNGGYGSNGYLSGIQIVQTTPEPSSFILCGLGAAGLFLAARRRRASRAAAPATSLLGQFVGAASATINAVTAHPRNLFGSVGAAGVLAILAAATAVSANTISVNFEGGNGNTTTTNGPSVTGMAGVVPVGNWNNEPGASGSGVAVVNQYGANAGTLGYTTGNVYGATPSGGGVSGSAGDTALMTGYLDNFSSAGASVTVSGLGGAFTTYGYEVLVYQNGDGNGSFGFNVVDSNSHTDTRYAEQTGGNGGNYPLVGGTNGFIGSTSTNPAGPGSAADYVILSGFNGSSFTLTGIAGTSGDTRAKIEGFQIIANTPEPSSFILCGLGAAGLFVAARRRRRRA